METAAPRLGQRWVWVCACSLPGIELRKWCGAPCQVLSHSQGGGGLAFPVPHLRLQATAPAGVLGLDECERVPDPGVLGGSGRGEASCLYHVTHGRGLCTCCGQPCTFARRMALRDTAFPPPGVTCKPAATAASTNMLSENTQLNLSSKLHSFLCPSKAGCCDGEVPRRALNHQLATAASPAGRRVVPTSRNHVLQDEDPHRLRPQIRG